jgi:hypothetical protein
VARKEGHFCTQQAFKEGLPQLHHAFVGNAREGVLTGELRYPAHGKHAHDGRGH